MMTWSRWICGGAFAALMAVAGCDSEESDDVADTQTRWLRSCDKDAECGDALACICGLCSLSCESAKDCSALGEGARCLSGDGCGGTSELLCQGGEDGGMGGGQPDSGGPNLPSSDAAVSTPPTTSGKDASVPGNTHDASPPPAASDAASQDAAASLMDAMSGDAMPADDAGSAERDAAACERQPEEYEFTPEQCAVIRVSCKSFFSDACGCGCDDEPVQGEDGGTKNCPRPIESYDHTPAECQLIDLDCAQFYSDECGCGCDPAPPPGRCRSFADCTEPAQGDTCIGPEDTNCGIPGLLECASDGECGDGLRCHAVTDGCRPGGIGALCGEPCGDAAPCEQGFVCNAGGSCRPQLCTSGYQCLAVQDCNPQSTPPEPLPVYDTSHGCQPVACSSDWDCIAGAACVGGRCQTAFGQCSFPAP